ncbi:MAG: acetylornithine deacetylase [Flavobacteriaceae bacterium]|jgi:acetylornithine deacetylase|nr:acetylornithine deacetylase [Bacteroidota bacterium]MDB2471031.1 acetylornithine deacetylase [Flavobacteriaceae bacterium]MDB2612651.1 acetylornithine deacetylase [Flavobacteriaceae bacterium]MDG1379531.1 acetylornithine deacetylase [Flavobacteriaceae bacterium]MDG2349920.1 acetylornithine deacetylase [Flavobacteriaceae bacterium]|tara:strand:+ start:988 stop:2154 length:1167 start_codon:yes stop_codon:yes gene_type:complete
MTAESILAKLVSFPVLGGQSNLSIINYIKDYIESFNIVTTLVSNKQGNKASLHCRIGPAIDGGVILSGHTDVVPVKGQEWSTNPFELIDKGDGKLYGRGSCDMKGFIACCLASLPDMVQADLKKPVYFAFSYDEEIGCLAGHELARSIKIHYRETPKYAIIGEPSLMQPIVGQKGIYILETYVNGSAGHSSRIKEEVSAIHEAMRLMLWLEEKMNRLIEEGRIDNRFHPAHSSIHIGLVNGGIAPNVIADKAHFFWDLRTIPMDRTETILEEFETFCRQREQELKSKFEHFKIKTVENHPPVVHLDTKETDDIVGLIKRISGNSSLSTVAYGAEAGQFAAEGFQSVICGPGSIKQAHRADEFIDKKELHKGVQMIHKLIAELSSNNFR